MSTFNPVIKVSYRECTIGFHSPTMHRHHAGRGYLIEPSHAGKLHEPSWRVSSLISKERITWWLSCDGYPAMATMTKNRTDLLFRRVRDVPSPRRHDCSLKEHAAQNESTTNKKRFHSLISTVTTTRKISRDLFHDTDCVSSGFDFLTL